MEKAKTADSPSDWLLVYADDGKQYLLNKRTSEAHSLIETMNGSYSTKGKMIRGSKYFWKLYLPSFLEVLRSFGNSQINVLAYILENMRQSDNVFIGSYRDISKGCQVSLDSVRRAIDKLAGCGFMVKKQNGVYIISPDILIKGNDSKKINLRGKYNEAADKAIAKEAETEMASDGEGEGNEET